MTTTQWTLLGLALWISSLLTHRAARALLLAALITILIALATTR
jgi:hypothetical protein